MGGEEHTWWWRENDKELGTSCLSFDALEALVAAAEEEEEEEKEDEEEEDKRWVEALRRRLAAR